MTPGGGPETYTEPVASGTSIKKSHNEIIKLLVLTPVEWSLEMS